MEYRKSVGMPGPARQFLFLSVALTLVTGIMAFATPWLYHLDGTHQWPFGRPEDPFRDLYLYKAHFAYFHSSQFFTHQDWPYTYMYPAPVAIVYKIFFSFQHFIRAFLGFALSGILIATGIFGFSLIRRGIRFSVVAVYLILALACSYPFIFVLQTANMEFMIWLLMSCGIWAFFQHRGYTAAACIGMAASMKIFPVIFLGLFLARRQYRQMAFSVLVGAVTTLISLWLLCPDIGISYRGVQAGIAEFRERYMLGYNSADHSLLSLVKTAYLLVSNSLMHHHGPPSPHTNAALLAVYLPVCAIGGIVLYFLVIRRLPIINQVICLTVASILLPPVSFDYTLMHLYAPWALLILFAIEMGKRKIPGLTGALICLAVLLCSDQGLLIRNHSFTGLIKAIALIVLMSIALRKPFLSSFDDYGKGNHSGWRIGRATPTPAICATGDSSIRL